LCYSFALLAPSFLLAKTTRVEFLVACLFAISKGCAAVVGKE
jgi:hypothetical protein